MEEAVGDSALGGGGRPGGRRLARSGGGPAVSVAGRGRGGWTLAWRRPAAHSGGGGAEAVGAERRPEAFRDSALGGLTRSGGAEEVQPSSQGEEVVGGAEGQEAEPRKPEPRGERRAEEGAGAILFFGCAALRRPVGLTTCAACAGVRCGCDL